VLFVALSLFISVCLLLIHDYPLGLNVIFVYVLLFVRTVPYNTNYSLVIKCECLYLYFIYIDIFMFYSNIQ
jgi:hypothetical protein